MAKYEEGGHCPNCQPGRLVRQEHREDWEPKPGQKLYYEYWYRCNECLSVFHDDRARRPIEEWRKLSA